MDQKNFKVYKSSAGSGKTFTLVREYLRLVIKNPNSYRNILAITFTNKAANEMKSRIVDSLVALSQPIEEWPKSLRAMIAPIKAEGRYSDDFIRQRAALVVANILHNYSDLAATTIDSFMQRVIRTFSLDLNLPHHYEVELEVDLLRRRAVDRLIDLAGTDTGLTGLLVHFLQTKTDDDKSWRIENDLDQTARALFSEDGVMHRNNLKNIDFKQFRTYHKKISDWLGRFEDELAGLGNQALKTIADQNLEITDFSYGKSGPVGYFLKLADKNVGEVSEPGARILSAVNDGVWVAKNKPAAIKASAESIAGQLTDYYRQSRELIDHSVKRYHTLKLLLQHLYPLAVLGSIEKIISEIREEEHILPISEFNSIIAEVTQTETIPYIYERLGEKYHHLMIDEFQDTSVLQWLNLLPLVENALSENYLNLVVGDAKQAIYRWRNGEVDQFISLPRLQGPQTTLNQLRENVLVAQYEGLELPVNWRSHKAIVEFNNQFFKHLSNRLAQPYKSVYDNLDQQHNPGKTDGFVQFEFFDPAEDSEKQMLDRITAIIREREAESCLLQDICILCRTNKQGSEVANHLLKNGIRVISSESLLLGFAKNVRLVSGMIRIVADPDDQIAYAETLAILSQQGRFGPMPMAGAINAVLHSPQTGSGKKQFRLSAFESFLSEHKIGFSRKQLLHLPLYDLAEELMRVLGLPVRTDIYLQFFLNGLHRVVTGKFLDIRGFREWWEEKGSSISVIFPDSLDAVKVMTVHKAKGLEFPVVIFPFATAGQRFTVDHVWVDIDDPLLENLKSARLPVKSLGKTIFENIHTLENEKSLLDLVNLLYVTFTRAEESLYVLTHLAETKSPEKNTISSFIRQFISDSDPDYTFDTERPWVYNQSVLKPGKAKPETKEPVGFSIKTETSSERWQNKAVTSSRSHGNWYAEDPENAIRFGTSIHDLLAQIGKAGDVAAVLDRFRLTGGITPEDQKKISQTLNHIIEHQELQQFFNEDPGILPEPEILLPGGEVFRPDRVLLGEKEIRIAEFKTGLQHASHKTQLLHYLEIVKVMQNKTVTGYLVYANENACEVEVLATF